MKRQMRAAFLDLTAKAREQHAKADEVYAQALTSYSPATGAALAARHRAKGDAYQDAAHTVQRYMDGFDPERGS